MKKIALFLTAILLGAAAQAQMTYQFTFSGNAVSPPNSATATGTVTFTAGNPPNPGVAWPGLIPEGISALSVTVTGAAAGNGTFGLASFSTWTWDSGAAGTLSLNLNTELVGQSTGSFIWGVNGGDFNLSATAGSGAPEGFGPLVLAANGGTGDKMALTSFAPIPEPHEYALLAGMGLLGFAGWRRRRA